MMSVRRADRRQDHPLATACHSVPKASEKPFFHGVMALSLSTALVKVIGLFYKIPMLRFLTSVGMGYFNAAYEWYAMLCVLFTAGLPIAVSMLIAKAISRAEKDPSAWQAVDRVERLSLRIFFWLGLVGSLALFFCADLIAQLIDSPMTAYTIRAVSPTVFFSCVSASYRGYFQGFQNMVPTAVSQLIEAIGKLLFGVLFAYFALRAGMEPPHVSAFAMLGLSLGVFISCIYLWAQRRKRSDQTSAHLTQGRCGSSLVKQLLTIAIPITLSSSVLSLTKIVDMTMILRCLQNHGHTVDEANALYGIYTTMAVPIFNLVPALLTSVSLALIPTLSAQISKGNRQAQRGTVSTSMRLTALLALPASMALAIYSRPVLALLFHADANQLQLASPMLSLLALSIVFSGLMTTSNAILQAYGHAKLPIYSMTAGCVIKLISAYILISRPSLQLMGAPLSTLLCNAAIVGINLYYLHTRTDSIENLGKMLLQPLVSSLLSVGIPALAVAYLTRFGIDQGLLFIGAVPITLLLLLGFCQVFGMIDLRILCSSGPITKITPYLQKFLPKLKKS